MKPEPFTITVHTKERVLEVRYPERPTMEFYEKYEVAVRAAILALAAGGPWDCIVDQTALRALAPEFPPRVAMLNTWAREHGMRRAARLVSDSAIGELQTLRILRDSGVSTIGAVFHDRPTAWKFVTTGQGSLES